MPKPAPHQQRHQCLPDCSTRQYGTKEKHHLHCAVQLLEQAQVVLQERQDIVLGLSNKDGLHCALKAPQPGLVCLCCHCDVYLQEMILFRSDSCMLAQNIQPWVALTLSSCAPGSNFEGNADMFDTLLLIVIIHAITPIAVHTGLLSHIPGNHSAREHTWQLSVQLCAEACWAVFCQAPKMRRAHGLDVM